MYDVLVLYIYIYGVCTMCKSYYTLYMYVVCTILCLHIYIHIHIVHRSTGINTCIYSTMYIVLDYLYPMSQVSLSLFCRRRYAALSPLNRGGNQYLSFSNTLDLVVTSRTSDRRITCRRTCIDTPW